MHITVQTIEDFFEEWAPSSTAASWDNVGLQLGDPLQAVNRVLLSLDVDQRVLNANQSHPYDLVITHHPLFFNSIKMLHSQYGVGKIVSSLIQTGTAVWSAHTNLDVATGGVNDQLIQLYDFDPVEATVVDEYVKVFHNHSKRSLRQLSQVLPVQNAFDASYVPKTIGFCAGSGKSFISSLFKQSIDCFITGELGYHEEVACQLDNKSYFMLGHAESEVMILSEIKTRLLAQYSHLNIDIIE